MEVHLLRQLKDFAEDGEWRNLVGGYEVLKPQTEQEDGGWVSRVPASPDTEWERVERLELGR